MRGWERMGARFVRFAGLCEDAACALLWRRLCSDGVYCAAWGHLSGGLAACFGAGMRRAFTNGARCAVCPAGALLWGGNARGKRMGTWCAVCPAGGLLGRRL